MEKLRSKFTYDRDIQILNQSKSKKTHENGIKFDSCLNDLKYFHVTNGLPPDVMHDVLEGVAQANIQLLMEYLIKNKRLHATELNDALKTFKYRRNDKKTK